MEGKRVAAYCRGSTLKQAITIPAQREKICAWIQYQSHDDPHWYCETESSKLREARPEFARLMGDVREGLVDILVVAKLDRLTRSVAEFSGLLDELRRCGTDLVVLDQSIDTTNATGRLIAHVLISLAQWEREVIAERTSIALAHKKGQGAKLGQAPYGWKKVLAEDGKMTRLIEEPEEQVILSTIRRLRAAGHAHEWIADYLNGLRMATRRGNPWHRRTIQDICERGGIKP